MCIKYGDNLQRNLDDDPIDLVQCTVCPPGLIHQMLRLLYTF